MVGYLKLFTVCISVLLILQGCCDRVHCPPESDAAVFSGFSATEMDSAVVTRYVKGSGFTEFADSFMVEPYFETADSTYLVWFSDGGTYNSAAQFDMQIYLPSPGFTYRIAEVKYERELCDKCGNKKSYRNRLLSYELNGILKVPVANVYPEFRISR